MLEKLRGALRERRTNAAPTTATMIRPEPRYDSVYFDGMAWFEDDAHMASARSPRSARMTT